MEGWQTGHIVADRYRLDKPIGSGGMGMVWRAEHIKLRSPVAIKVLPHRIASDDIRSARFIREAQAAAAIRSTNVVQVLDYGVDDGIAYIAMEYLEGESLADRLDRMIRLGPRETLAVITQVARAISRAHKKGIIHRDLKPANIFLSREDDGDVVKVLDFGIAKLTDKKHGTDQTTQTGYLLGTPNYMSPEQTRGHKIVDHRTDVWSLGIVAFECLCGERPVDGETVGDIIYKICSEDMPKPSRVAPVPLGFDRWFRKATERDPDQRFQSAKEMARALADALSEIVPVSEPDSRDSMDSLERESIELSDTLAAARRASELAPDSSVARTHVTIDSDSWDRELVTVDSGSGVDTQVSAPPPDSGEVSLSDVVTADGPMPQSSTSGVTVGESLRGTAALSRTAESARPPARRRWVYAAIAGATIAVAIFFALGETTTAQAPAGTAASTLPHEGSARADGLMDGEVVPPRTASAPVQSSTAKPDAPGGASAVDEASDGQPVPRPGASAKPNGTRVTPPSGPRAKPSATPPKTPPAPGSDRIDFGI